MLVYYCRGNTPVGFRIHIDEHLDPWKLICHIPLPLPPHSPLPSRPSILLGGPGLARELP